MEMGDIHKSLRDGLNQWEENGKSNAEQRVGYSMNEREQKKGSFYWKGWLEMGRHGMTKSM